MKRYSLSHLSDYVLLHDLASLVSQHRKTSAELLAHIAEVDARKLYLPAAYQSMIAYCVGELRLSEDSAAKRIQAARVARKFPAIFEALADGRLHLSGVWLLAPHLTAGTVEALLAVATHKSKSEIEQLLAERFPRPDEPTMVRAISPNIGPACQYAPGHVDGALSTGTAGHPFELAPGQVGNGTAAQPFQHAPGRVGTVEPRPGVKPLTPERCSAISCRPGSSPRCSTAPSMRLSTNSRSASSRPRRSREQSGASGLPTQGMSRRA